MNEITRIPPTTAVTTTSAAIERVRAAFLSDIARQARSVASEIMWTRQRGYEDELAHVAAYQRVIAMAEQLIASPDYRALIATLRPAIQPATLKQIKDHIGGLIACFPTQQDVTVFVAFAIEDVAAEQPSMYALAAACRELRRTKTFRPSIPEILEALNAKDCAGTVRWFAGIPDQIEAMRRAIGGER
jgi:hypothetical protein